MISVEQAVPDIIKEDMAAIVHGFSRSPFSDNIRKIILFGSFASKKYQPDSDIDIALVLHTLPPKSQLADYYLLADNAGRETDLLLCTEEQLRSGKFVYAEILREGVVVYENL